MIPYMKRLLRRSLNRIGYDVIRLKPHERLHLNLTNVGRDPFLDMVRFLPENRRTLIFDVGANEGQSIQKFRDRFPHSIIHSFEPSPSTFQTLRAYVQGLEDVYSWNYALGALPGKMKLLENKNNEMSSFLPLGVLGWGEIIKETEVPVQTIDQFCLKEDIRKIDILKSDTQGFDLEVLKGAERMIRSNAIGLIYLEITFSEIYENLPSLADIFTFLTSHSFYLVSFYRIYYRSQLASWTDALFVHSSNIPPEYSASLR